MSELVIGIVIVLGLAWLILGVVAVVYLNVIAARILATLVALVALMTETPER
jgi:hypothetical protein